MCALQLRRHYFMIFSSLNLWLTNFSPQSLSYFGRLWSFRGMSSSHRENIKNITKLSANQLSLPCKILQNIIAHIIFPRKGNRNKVSNFDLFILDSFLVGRKHDFPIALGLMKLLYSSQHIKTLPYRMLHTKIFKHFDVPLSDETCVKLHPTDTISIQTLKRMKIVKSHGQWVAHTKGFDPSSGPSTLSFEGNE